MWHFSSSACRIAKLPVVAFADVEASNNCNCGPLTLCTAPNLSSSLPRLVIHDPLRASPAPAVVLSETLLFQDLWELPEKDRMNTVADSFENAYARERDKCSDRLGNEGAASAASADGQGRGKRSLIPAAVNVPLIRALWALYRGQFLTVGAVRFLNTSVQFLPAILVQRLLR